jgi:CheY-like chemotaxis protein
MKIGCLVKEAAHGAEAVSVFKKWDPHFIWMDIRMPEMDGFEATRKIRELPDGETVRIVAITASVLAERHQEILACGCDEVVRKPYRDHEIYDTMARHLGIQYIYKETTADAPLKVESAVTAAMLSDLSPELLHELDDACLTLNSETILAVITRIENDAPEITTGLRDLLNNYQIGRIRELIDKI